MQMKPLGEVKETYLRDSPSKNAHRPAGLLLPAFGGRCSFLSGIPLAIVFLGSFPLFQPQIVAGGAGSFPAPGLKSSRACLRSGTRLALLLSILSRSLGRLQKQFYNLAAGRNLPSTPLLARFLGRLISQPFL